MTEQDQMINDCINRQSRLSPKEVSFIATIMLIKDNNQALSYEQAITLDDLWERITEQG